MSKFKLWVEDNKVGTGTQDYSVYVNETQRQEGFKGGTPASAIIMNTALRQASLITVALMEALIPNDTSHDLTTDLSTMTNVVTNALKAVKVNNASNADEATIAQYADDDESKGTIEERFAALGKTVKVQHFDNANIGWLFVNALLGKVLPLAIKVNTFTVSGVRMSIGKQSMDSNNVTVSSEENHNIIVDYGFYMFNGMDYMDMSGGTRLAFTGRRKWTNSLYKQTICLTRQSSDVSVVEESVHHEYHTSSSYEYYSCVTTPVINSTAIGALVTSLDFYYIELT